jgi:hypothetical protein
MKWGRVKPKRSLSSFAKKHGHLKLLSFNHETCRLLTLVVMTEETSRNAQLSKGKVIALLEAMQRQSTTTRRESKGIKGHNVQTDTGNTVRSYPPDVRRLCYLHIEDDNL